MRGGAKRTIVDLGEPEDGLLGRQNDVGVSGNPDAGSETEVVDRRDHRDGAFIHRAKELEAGPICLKNAFVGIKRLHFLDVDPSAESTAQGGKDHNPNILIAPIAVEQVG